ncbi:MAG: CHAD domain-containing protein, partial [Gemmatimonadaceae bacterium]|nr:CHAD domain-containing protein [Gemmatimonadaceae bacterium]
ARVVALALLADLRQEREKLAAARASETLHDFRVALRRQRSWLRAMGPVIEGSVPAACKRRLRRMSRESNAGRDAEVFLAWLATVESKLTPRNRPAVAWLRERFARQEHEAEAELEARLSRDFERTRARLEERLSMYQVNAHVYAGVRELPFSLVLAELLKEMSEELRRRLRRVRSADDVNEAHQARIAGKRLRYVLEPVAPFLPGGDALLVQLRGLQDILGDLHDSHVWLMVLRHVIADLALEEGRRMASAFNVGRSPRKRAGGGDQGPPRAGLVSLARLAHDHSVTAYERYTEEWNEDRTKAFLRDMAGLAESLEAGTPSTVEIERKYLLKRLPRRLPDATTLRIEQGYLPGRQVAERLRVVEARRRKSYFRTIKVGSGLVRTELEEETTAEVFRAMWPLTKGRRLTKKRHRVPDGDLVWDVDEFTDRELVLAEVELPSAETPVEFPKWLAPFVVREVTGDPAYLNSTLAR